VNRGTYPREAVTDEIVSLAKMVWSDAKMREAIVAVGVDGDLEDSASDALASMVQDLGREHFPNVATGHLMLVEPILRSFSEGGYAGFNDPLIEVFVASHKVPLSGQGWAPVRPVPLPVVLGWFRYFDGDPKIKDMFLRSKGKEFLEDADSEWFSAKVAKRMRKYGLYYSRGAESFAQGYFHKLATEAPSEFSDQELIKIFRNDSFYKMGVI